MKIRKKVNKKQIIGKTLSSLMVAAMILPSATALTTYAADNDYKIFINEIESNDPNGGNDWIEIVNAGTTDVDISGWFVTDDGGLDRVSESKTYALGNNTILKSGEVLVLEEKINFDFGLGKSDTVSLYDSNSNVVDTHTYSGHAGGTYSRVPDGTGEFVDQASTKNSLNILTGDPENVIPTNNSVLVINEVNSSPDDWVELMNTGETEIDLTGYEIRDNSDDHRWRFPDDTKIAAGSFLVVDAKDNGLIYNDTTASYEAGTFEAAIGIGSGDSIRLYDKDGNNIDACIWTEHASYEGDAAKASIGRYPDGRGEFCITKETKGQPNDWYKPEIVINEIESNKEGDTDWVEIMNIGNTPVDISGWYLLDNDPVAHKADTTPLADGTILNPGEFYVFEENINFSFGLGKADCAAIYNKSDIVIAEYSWTAHANGVLARIPDGTGDFIDFNTATKGKANIVTNPVVINEVQSNDKNGGPDWIELANPTGEELDVSGIVIKDNDDTHEYIIPEGTKISANGFLVINNLPFGLGKGDSVRLYENGTLIAETTWTDHTNPSWGLYPDVNGSEYRSTKKETPGAANSFSDIPEIINWPGSDEVKVFDTKPIFFEDSSGLDFHNGRLYAVDNGTATFWILDVSKDGSIKFADGYEKGKRVHFKKDANNLSSAGPDSEGITVDDNGMVYLAVERDNCNKGINFNNILMVDPNVNGTNLIALKEWDLTSSLPQVSANMGIEAVEWVSNEDVNGKLMDQNTSAVFNSQNYPDAYSGGVFFVALEDNGHVYAYVLNTDESCVQIADIDTKLGGAMALDYDKYEGILWAAADNGYSNKSAKIYLNGTITPDITHVLPAAGVDITANNEGFAIADADYTVNGKRPVYRFCDGVKSGALTIGYIDCNVKEQETEEPEIKPVEYSVTDGADSEITTGKDEEITIRINGELSMFVSVEVDGNLVDSKYYKVKSGSTIITFTSEFLNTLSVGKHTIKVSYTDGEATTSFTIKNIETENENAPHAGDTSNMLLWIILALVSTGCAILCIPKLKKVN